MASVLESRRRLSSLAMALALLGSVLLWSAPEAAAAKPRPLDHFRCYRVLEAQPPAVGVVVLLQDQFDLADGVAPEAFVRDPTWFCNPTEKRHGQKSVEITNPDGHLQFYAIDTEPGPERVIRYRNQFERGRAHLGVAIMLAVPTQKEGHQPPAPGSLDHFKCYEVLDAEPANTVVGLTDQWRTEPQVEVGGPAFFCNPTRKIHVDGSGVGVNNPRRHLMCYRTSQSPGVITTILTLNQFGDAFLIVDNAEVLCVPTQKGKKITIL